MAINDFERLVEPQILDKTRGDDIPVRLQQIKSDRAWPFFTLTQHTPLKTLAFYQFDTTSKEEQARMFKLINKI